MGKIAFGSSERGQRYASRACSAFIDGITGVGDQISSFFRLGKAWNGLDRGASTGYRTSHCL